MNVEINKLNKLVTEKGEDRKKELGLDNLPIFEVKPVSRFSVELFQQGIDPSNISEIVNMTKELGCLHPFTLSQEKGRESVVVGCYAPYIIFDDGRENKLIRALRASISREKLPERLAEYMTSSSYYPLYLFRNVDMLAVKYYIGKIIEDLFKISTIASLIDSSFLPPQIFVKIGAMCEMYKEFMRALIKIYTFNKIPELRSSLDNISSSVDVVKNVNELFLPINILWNLKEREYGFTVTGSYKEKIIGGYEVCNNMYTNLENLLSELQNLYKFFKTTKAQPFTV